MKINLKPGIRLKLTLIILFVSLVPLLLLGHFAYNDQRLIITEEVTESHNELSNTLAHGIYQNLEFTRKLLNAITSLDLIRKLNPEVSQDFFAALMNNFSFFKLMYLIDSERQIISSTEPGIKLPENWLYSNAIRRSYQGALSEINTATDGSLFMTLESVVATPERHGITGVLISQVNLQSIHNLLNAALQNSRSEGLIIDEKGRVIARSSPETPFLKVSYSDAVKNDLTKVRSIEGENYLITAISLKKFDFYQAPNWTIILQIPERQAFYAANLFRKRLIRIFTLTALIATFFAILLAHNFIAPISTLAHNAAEISSGDFSHEIRVRSTDEIGGLADSFEEMRVSLRDTKADLEYRILQLSTLYEVGKAISSVLDFKRLQNTILETVVKVLKAEKGSLMLTDDTEKVLTIGVAIGLSDNITKKTRIEVGESIAGYVVKSKTPLFVTDTSIDQHFTKLKGRHAKAGTMMCAPLIAKDKVLGALNVSKSDPGTFSSKDFELFKNLANQASIAIENARLYRYAVTDEMTRLYNHRYFQQRLDEELLRADRYENHVSLIILDVDHFKHFNDTYGHPEGDRVLKAVSRIIEKSVREIDIAARYGGEEFVVICPEKRGEGALAPAERIRLALANYDFRIGGKQVPITVSLGLAGYPDQAQTKEELIQFADYALYYSKQHGRNQTTIYNPIMNRTN